jgi:hypothetical protein
MFGWREGLAFCSFTVKPRRSPTTDEGVGLPLRCVVAALMKKNMAGSRDKIFEDHDDRGDIGPHHHPSTIFFDLPKGPPA